MGHIRGFTVITLILLSIGGCSAGGNAATRGPALDSSAATLTSVEAPSVNLSDDIHADPMEGGIKEYLQRENILRYSSVDADWISFMASKGQVTVNWGEVQEVEFIPVCDAKSGKFVLYKDGKNIGNVPCGPGQVNSISPPRPTSAAEETFYFEIHDATKSEVAVFQKKA